MERIDGLLDWTTQDALHARAAHEARNARLQASSMTDAVDTAARPIAALQPMHLPRAAALDEASKQAVISNALTNALAKARARRSQHTARTTPP